MNAVSAVVLRESNPKWALEENYWKSTKSYRPFCEGDWGAILSLLLSAKDMMFQAGSDSCNFCPRYDQSACPRCNSQTRFSKTQTGWTNGRSDDRAVGRSDGRSCGRTGGWTVGQTVGRSASWTVSRTVGQSHPLFHTCRKVFRRKRREDDAGIVDLNDAFVLCTTHNLKTPLLCNL